MAVPSALLTAALAAALWKASLWAHSSGSVDQGTPVTRLREGRIADVVRSVEGAAWEAPERRLNIPSSLYFPLLELTPATLT